MRETLGEAAVRVRLLDKLLRELARSEAQTLEHGPRETRRIGDVPPTRALHELGLHAARMRARLARVLELHELGPARRIASTTFTTLRNLVADRAYDGERAYRGVLLDLRHGVDVVRVLRDCARTSELFALIRWCDDWLAARRTLIASAEAHLAWFSESRAYGPIAATDDVSSTDPRDAGA